MVKCDASDKTGLDEATAKADKTARSVKADAKTLQAAVRAVESSKLDKTVDDADGLYRATEGKVQDDKTRDALKQAIAKRDADAIAKAVKAVNDSKTAKDQADAEAAAKAQAEQEAAAQAAAAQQAQQQAQRSYSYGSYSSGGWSGSAGRTVLFRRIVFRRIARPGWRLPERELPRAKHPLRLGRQYWGSIQLPAG